MAWIRHITVVFCMFGIVIGHGSPVLAMTELDSHAHSSVRAAWTTDGKGLDQPAAELAVDEDCADAQSHHGSRPGHGSGSCHTLLSNLTSNAALSAPCWRARPMMPPPCADFMAADSGVELPPPKAILL